MNEEKPQFNWRWTTVYAVSVLVFLSSVAGSYRTGYGFSSLIMFGDRFSQESISGLGCYVAADSAGYDGQFYAKLALNPLLLHPLAKNDIDTPIYRARRILPAWTAWILGFGRPAWIIQIFALQNVVCWLILAWLLLKWFPPLDFNNYIRWIGVLFSTGLIDSVTHSLSDGPSLLFVALALNFAKKDLTFWASGMLAAAGMSRETNLLALPAILGSPGRSPRELCRFALRIGLAVAPLAIWLIYLKLRLAQQGGALGGRNFAIPFAGYLHKWRDLGSPILAGHHYVFRFLLPLIALTTQFLFFCANPKCWRNPCWRLGAAYAVLMVFLGDAVWEGLPGAAPRVLLPMTLAFNILLPRGRHYLALLLLGNLWLFWPVLPRNPPPKHLEQRIESSSLQQAPSQ